LIIEEKFLNPPARTELGEAVTPPWYGKVGLRSLAEDNAVINGFTRWIDERERYL